MRLIDADAFYKQLEEIRMEYLEENTLSSNFAAEVIETVMDSYLQEAPTIEAEPVKRGKWFDVGSLSCRCNRCGCKNSHETDYCPHCGAKLDGE